MNVETAFTLVPLKPNTEFSPKCTKESSFELLLPPDKDVSIDKLECPPANETTCEKTSSNHDKETFHLAEAVAEEPKEDEKST